jgi:hypothetical protein
MSDGLVLSVWWRELGGQRGGEASLGMVHERVSHGELLQPAVRRLARPCHPQRAAHPAPRNSYRAGGYRRGDRGRGVGSEAATEGVKRNMITLT